MNRKITLTALLVLITLFAFGQNTAFKTYENYSQSKIETGSNELNHDNHLFAYPHFYQKNKNHSQSLGSKSTQDIKQRMDSDLIEVWDEATNMWVFEEKYEYAYDSNGNNTLQISYLWDEINIEWVFEVKHELGYDVHGNLTQWFMLLWDEIEGQWINFQIHDYEYNSDGIWTYSISFLWNETSSQWINYYYYEREFGDNGEQIQDIRYKWDETTSQWINANKWDYSNDENGYMIQWIYYDWDETTSQWVYYSKLEFDYDTEGNNIQDIFSYWDEIEVQWIYYSKHEYDYDADRNNIQDIYSNWDEINSHWGYVYKYEYEYSDNGNQTLSIEFNWDDGMNEWVNYSKLENTFDDTYSFSDLILPWLWAANDTVLFNHMLTNIMYFDWDDVTSDWEISLRDTFYYSEQEITSIEEIVTEEIKVYPNPFSEYVTFSIPNNHAQITFELFDMQGRKVMSEEIRSDEKVNMEALNQGVYFYNLIINGEKVNGKLIKQ